ncbi:Cro/CI family transcriptional regulator [Hydrogenophaga sp.]
MNLPDYFTSEPGAQARLAKALDVPAPLLSQWKTGERRVPAERCPLIERATGGKVRCEDLRPDVAWDVLRLQTEPAAAGITSQAPTAGA